MKSIVNLLLGLVFSGVVSCQEIRTVRVTVIEEDKTPIEGVNTTVTFLGYGGGDTQRKNGVTGADGVFQATGKAPLRMNVRCEKLGYYKTSSGRLSRESDHDLMYVLRKVKNPVPLYSRRWQIVAPEKDKSLGFDLEVGDWVKPHGVGKKTDMLINVHHEKTDLWNFDYNLTVSFPNSHDGIQQFKMDQFSELGSPYYSPEDGYSSKWKQVAKRSGKDSKVKRNADPLRGHWLRIRTKVDDEGNVVSANYVKIYGDFPDVRYYFNPTPNDRNLEFDPARNLFKNLAPMEQVRKP